MYKKGFTLIELLVVIAIIGILATVVLASLANARQKSTDVVFLNKVKQLQKAIELYELDNGHYPANGPFNTGSKSTTGQNISGNCENIATNYHNNWNLLVNELDGYFPDNSLAISGDWPVCIFYLHGSYFQCDDEANPDYTIIFGIKSSNYQNLDEYNV